MKVTTINGSAVELFPGVRLEDAMLRNLDLAGIDLSGSSIRESYFNESNLKNAKLCDCDLSGSVFYRTNLIGADLTGATLHRCYWNEVIHDSTTKWPAGFTFPTGNRVAAEVNHEAPAQYFPTGLCTPGVIPAAELDIEIPRPTRFVPLTIPVRKASQNSHEQLLLRLVALFYRATMRHTSIYEYLETNLFDYRELLDEDDAGDVFFTHACLALLATGFTVENVLDQERIEVAFSPVDHMRQLVESPQFRLLVLLFEELCGIDHVDDPTIENSTDLEPESHAQWLFFEDLGYDFDLSEVWSDTDGSVQVTPGRVGTADPKSEVLKSLLSYFFMSEKSILALDEETSEPKFEAETDHNLFQGPAYLMWHIMGVESINRSANGGIRAILRPRIDVEAALTEIGYLTEDDRDDDLWKPESFATRPYASRFSGHLLWSN